MSALLNNTARRGLRTGLSTLLLLALLLLAALIHLGIGARPIGPATVWQAFMHYQPANFDHRVIIDLRLLRLIAALLTGAALGVAGVLLQTVVRNPLGEPHLLGLNAGAALAVVLTAALGLGGSGLSGLRPLVAAAGGGALFALVMLLASAGRSGLTPLKVTLCGVALSAFASAITAAVLILDEQTLLSMRIWLAGDLAGQRWQTSAAAALPALAGLLLALWISPRLNILVLGDRAATGLGVPVVRTRFIALLAAALLCGAAVSVAGPLGFIGLVVPQLVRRLVGGDLRIVLPLSALTGALLLLLADIAARMLLAPQELATGIMTALVGAPVFIGFAARLVK